MGDDEFFKRIAETEQQADSRPSDQRAGTAQRRGRSASGGRTEHKGLTGANDGEVSPGSEDAVEDRSAPSRRSRVARSAASSRSGAGRIPPNAKRIGAIAGVCAVIVTVLIVVAGSGGHRGSSASSARVVVAEGVGVQLAALRADHGAMRESVAHERALRQAELRRLIDRRTSSRKRTASANLVVDQGSPEPAVPPAPVGAQESFGFERP